MSQKIQQLQLLQQNLQQVNLQKQQLEVQITELDSALEHIGKSNTTYKIVGKLMISTPQENLAKEIKEQKEVVDIRLKNFVEQEKKLQEQVEEVQKSVMSDLKNE